MIIDTRQTMPDWNAHWDVCIIGAGAAGISLALEFLSDTHLNILLLEAGGLDYDAGQQDLYRGELDSDHHAPLVRARYCGFGGSTKVWAGWCRPLDAEDFMPNPLRTGAVWPFAAAELSTYYERAATICGLNPNLLTSADGLAEQNGKPLLEDPDINHALFQIRVLDFADQYYQQLNESRHITVALNAPVLSLQPRSGQPARVDVEIGLANAEKASIKPRMVVLACGGLENPRLLLLSGHTPEQAIGNQYGNVGRYFTEHGFADPGWFIPQRSDLDLQFYFNCRIKESNADYATRPVLTLNAKARERLGLMNAALYFYPAYEAHQVFTVPAVKAALEFWEIRKNRAIPDGQYGLLLKALTAPHQLLHALWRRKFIKPPVKRWRLRMYYECRPVAENRVTLGNSKDRFGRPRLHLQWRLQDNDLESAHRFCQHIDQRLQNQEVGSLLLPPTAADWRALTECGKHPMGTTRMADNPRQGVVDSNARVFATENLYIAGSSVFPTVGYANPTLTLVALAVRLADHLKTRLKSL